MSLIKVEKATPARLKELKVENWSPWECGPETFDWEYDTAETAYIKEGRVKVSTEEGQEVELSKGDIAFFPKGLKCTWTVIEPIRKVYTFK